MCQHQQRWFWKHVVEGIFRSMIRALSAPPWLWRNRSLKVCLCVGGAICPLLTACCVAFSVSQQFSGFTILSLLPTWAGVLRCIACRTSCSLHIELPAVCALRIVLNVHSYAEITSEDDHPPPPPVVCHAFLKDTGVIYGMTSAASAISGSVGTYGAGVILDTTDSWTMVFQVKGPTAAVGFS